MLNTGLAKKQESKTFQVDSGEKPLARFLHVGAGSLYMVAKKNHIHQRWDVCCILAMSNEAEWPFNKVVTASKRCI